MSFKLQCVAHRLKVFSFIDDYSLRSLRFCLIHNHEEGTLTVSFLPGAVCRLINCLTMMANHKSKENVNGRGELILYG